MHYKYYLDPKVNFEGVYAGPFLSYRTMNFQEPFGGSLPAPNTTKTATNTRLGYILGYMYRVSEVVCMDFGIGGAYSLSNGSYKSVSDGLGIYSRGVTVHFNVGVGVYLR